MPTNPWIKLKIVINGTKRGFACFLSAIYFFGFHIIKYFDIHWAEKNIMIVLPWILHNSF